MTEYDEPPEETHGFLEQFAALSRSSVEELVKVAELGLNAGERMMLIKVAMKLCIVALAGAKEEDFTSEIKEELESLALELTTLP